MEDNQRSIAAIRRHQREREQRQDEVLSEVISVRLSPTEKKALDGLAKALRLKPSATLRALLLMWRESQRRKKG